MEYGIQRRLRKSPDNRHFAGVRKCKVFHGRRKYRMYTDYAQHGNGKMLIELYQAKGPEARIPEPMICCIFEALVGVALVMQRGSVSSSTRARDTEADDDEEDGESEESTKDWTQTVHRDIKPDNVFFDLPDGGAYPTFAKPVLGDFGSAIQTNEDDPLNPDEYREDSDLSAGNLMNGMMGYQAPETVGDITHKNFTIAKDQKILAHTNVWGIGVTIMSFMNLEYFEGGGADYDFNDENPLKKVPTLVKAVKGFYSSDLRSLVEACVAFQPNNRPELVAVWNEILSFTDVNSATDHSKGMREGAPTCAEGPIEVARPPTRFALRLPENELPPREGAAAEDKGA